MSALRVRLEEVCVQDRVSVRAGERPELRYLGMESIESQSGALLCGDLSKTPESPEANSFLFSESHVLYGKLRPYLNKVHIPVFEGKCSTELVPLRPTQRLKRQFLAYFLRSPPIVEKISQRVAGARMPRADMSFIMSMEISLPTLEAQDRIVDLLSRAENIVRMRKEAEAKAKETIPALFSEMFGDPARNPKMWEIRRIEDIASYTRYGPRFPDRKYAETGAHILRTTDMDVDGNVRWKESPVLPVTPEEVSRFSLQPGTIVITRTGATIGKIALFRGAKQPCIAGAYLIELGVKDLIHPEYLLSALLSEFGQSALTSGSRAVAQPNLNAPTIRAIALPIPPMPLQALFAKRAMDLRELREQLTNGTALAESTFQSLLAGMFGEGP